MRPLALFRGIPFRPILWLATLLHLVWGVALVLIPGKVASTTGLAAFQDHPEFWGLIMILSANAAFAALFHEARGNVNAWTFWAFIPQQTLLMITAASVIFYVVAGHYASGTDLPRWFIFIDQVPKLLLALFHPFGILRMHVPILPEDRINGPR